MLDRLLRLILIVSWYPQSRGTFGAAASGIESKSKKTATSPTCTRAPRAGLVRGTDDKETVTSDVEILNTSWRACDRAERCSIALAHR
jgi:hypothetical protein